MKFAVININRNVVAIHPIQNVSLMPGCKVKPIMSMDEWIALPKEYRGFVKGKPCVMYMDSNGYTVFGSVYLIDSWDAFQPDLFCRYRDLIVDQPTYVCVNCNKNQIHEDICCDCSSTRMVRVK